MNRKIVITKLENKTITTVFENEEAVELHCAKPEELNRAELGNIYIGKVKNIVKNIGAAFIEIENGLECYYAISENPAPIFTHKAGKKSFSIGDELLVQISKEAVKTKAPTVTSKCEFAGKYGVLTSGDTRIGASLKLSETERQRLTELAKEYASEKYGLIMRTNAKDVEEAVLRSEIEWLISEYEKLTEAAKTRICFSCLKRAPQSYLTELKNVPKEGLTEIVVEDSGIYEETKNYLETYQPEDLEKLRLYEDKLLPLHKLYSIEKHIEHALRERVWLKSGAYLVIQPTEALTVIDVNTGKCIDKGKTDQAYLKINMEAAKEAAKQIRLRNLTGIILIDFINLSGREPAEELLAFLEKELKKDPIAATLVDITKLQLVELTRKKIRKPFHEAFYE